jgi:hypothetical protein
MRALIVTLGGSLTARDRIMIVARHPQKGGQSFISYTVPDPVDIIEVAENGRKSVKTVVASFADACRVLVSQVEGGQGLGADQFEANVRGDDGFVIKCKDHVSDLIWSAEIEGAKTETVKIEDM